MAATTCSDRGPLKVYALSVEDGAAFRCGDGAPRIVIGTGPNGPAIIFVDATGTARAQIYLDSHGRLVLEDGH